MASKRAPGGSGRRTLSLLVMALGALVLLSMPLAFAFFAFSGERTQIQGIFVIASATVGMALVVIGAALRD
ncbi:MAG TPA: hypothetical protein VEW94_04570 [Chloroflexia bacterium]|nr:hypothetical protein [Chloroflexia bacterium]